MNTNALLASLLLAVLLCAACSQRSGGEGSGVLAHDDAPAPALVGDADDDDGDDDGDDEEERVPLDEVPEDVKAAAVAAVPGLELEGAEREVENGVLTYDLYGVAAGTAYEVEVTADGEVREIEQGEDDD